ncbi:MAG: acyl-CoA dehydrogenase C-terminal domain-containing protein [Aliidongia sp.]
MARLPPRFLDLMGGLDAELAAQPGDDLATIRQHLSAALDATAQATRNIVALVAEDPARAAGGAVPYLNLFAVTAGGWVLAKQALAAQARLAGRAGDPNSTRPRSWARVSMPSSSCPALPRRSPPSPAAPRSWQSIPRRYNPALFRLSTTAGRSMPAVIAIVRPVGRNTSRRAA